MRKIQINDSESFKQIKLSASRVRFWGSGLFSKNEAKRAGK